MHRLIACCLIFALAAPWLSLLPLAGSLKSWDAWREVSRIGELAAATAELAALAALLALPLGTLLAILLFRTDMAGAAPIRVALLFALFLPLPLWAASWQAAARWAGLRTSVLSQLGIMAAAGIHGLAALPWVVWLIGLGLRRVDRDREEDALVSMPAAKVLVRVTLPEVGSAIALAAFGIVLQCLGEIAITDLTGTRTLAEEVYLQFSGDRYGLEHSIVLFLPVIAIFSLLASRLVRRPAQFLGVSPAPPILFRLGGWRRPVSAAAAALVTVGAAVPLAALLHRAATGSLHEFLSGLLSIGEGQGALIVSSLLWSGCAGLLAAAVGLQLGMLAVSSRWWREAVFALAVVIWVTPGPVVGFGVNAFIQRLLDLEDFCFSIFGSPHGLHPINELLYNSPSPLPVLWAHTIRLFPWALVVLWPALRGIPQELFEAARLDGARGLLMFRAVVWPACHRAFWLSALVGAALALGELSAAKIAQVPGRRTFIEELFSQMHYGADVTVARLCLVQLGVSSILVALIAWTAKLNKQKNTETT